MLVGGDSGLVGGGVGPLIRGHGVRRQTLWSAPG